MASRQCYKETYETCSPVNNPSMANPGQTETQCYRESRTYCTDFGMGKTQTTESYTTQTTGNGSSPRMRSSYGMGSTYGNEGHGRRMYLQYD